jgi:hypothetical protein
MLCQCRPFHISFLQSITTCMKTRLYISQTQPSLLCRYTHMGDMFRLIFKSSSGPFLRYRSLLPTLNMHYGIPNAYNFGIMTLYRYMFHRFYYLHRVHSLYILKIIKNGSYFFIPILLKYVKKKLPLLIIFKMHKLCTLCKVVFDWYIILFSCICKHFGMASTKFNNNMA